MRKLLFLLFMLAIYLTFPTLSRSEFYVIRLKNGNSLATPLCWSEGGQVYFFYAGGTVGVEKEVIERVEKHQGTRTFFGSSAADTQGTKPVPPLSAVTETLSVPPPVPEVKTEGKGSLEKGREAILKKQLQEELRTLETERVAAVEKYQKVSEQDSSSKKERDEARNEIFTTNQKKKKLLQQLQGNNQQ